MLNNPIILINLIVNKIIVNHNLNNKVNKNNHNHKNNLMINKIVKFIHKKNIHLINKMIHMKKILIKLNNNN